MLRASPPAEGHEPAQDCTAAFIADSDSFFRDETPGARITHHTGGTIGRRPEFCALCSGPAAPIFQAMAERRYDDREMAAIFRAASESPQLPAPREVSPDEGLTLADLQAIGREV